MKHDNLPKPDPSIAQHCEAVFRDALYVRTNRELWNLGRQARGLSTLPTQYYDRVARSAQRLHDALISSEPVDADMVPLLLADAVEVREYHIPLDSAQIKAITEG